MDIIEHLIPKITADNVRRECQKRMMRLLGVSSADALTVKLSNATREATRLQQIKLGGVIDPETGEAIPAREWNEDEAALASYLAQTNAAVDALREASNAMESDPPEDYWQDHRWLGSDI